MDEKENHDDKHDMLRKQYAPRMNHLRTLNTGAAYATSVCISAAGLAESSSAGIIVGGLFGGS